MRRVTSLILLLIHPFLSLSTAIEDLSFSDSFHPINNPRISSVCERIQRRVSSATQVFYPGNPSFILDNEHYSVSSSQFSACSVEPGTANDVAVVLQILGLTRTPFGVKCGGHSYNPGFSSTTGVQISMNRFKAVEYNSTTKIATIGGGMIWDDVYAALLPYGVNVPGGRVDGIGVSGFVLGGGYTWNTNQFGLAMDLIVEYELIKPNGHIIRVDEHTDPELFFALKGGFNNFGIVTQFKFKTVPQGLVWGGYSVYIGGQEIDALQKATNRFMDTVTDPKAEIILNYASSGGMDLATLLIFYDAPEPPAGIFEDILAIIAIKQDVKTRDYLSLVSSPQAAAAAGSRTVYHTIATTGYNEAFINAIRKEVSYWSIELSNKSVSAIAYAVEPFLPTIFTGMYNNRTLTAYPPPKAKTVCPLGVQWVYESEEYDAYLDAAVRESLKRLRKVAAEQGLLGDEDDAEVLYPNYVIHGTPVEDLYGENLERLRNIRQRVDPDNVMYLTGGFKF